MPAAVRGRRYVIVGASLAAHAAVLTAVALHAPYLKVPPPVSGPPEAIIPVLIIPRAPPPAASPPGTKPTPIRLHQRRQPFADDDTPPIPPLVIPMQPAAPAPKAAPPTANRPVYGPTAADDALARNARAALRSRIDCNSPNLTRAEREGCMERFADRHRDTPFQGLGVDRDKASALEAAARRREQDYNYKRSAPGGVGVSGTGRNAGAIERPGDPNKGMGATSQDLQRGTGNDSRGTLKVPF